MSLNVLRNFCRVLQISPKHFKISQYESCLVFRGTKISCWMAFQIEWKRMKILVKYQHLLFTETEWHSKFGNNLCKIRWEKYPRAFVKVVEGSEIYNFPILCALLFKILEIFAFKQGHWNAVEPERARAPRRACQLRAPSVFGPTGRILRHAPSRDRMPRGRTRTGAARSQCLPRSAPPFASYPRCPPGMPLPAVEPSPFARAGTPSGSSQPPIKGQGRPRACRAWPVRPLVCHRSTMDATAGPFPVPSSMTMQPPLRLHRTSLCHVRSCPGRGLARADAPATGATRCHRARAPTQPRPRLLPQIGPW
jgi:hypothetical protein